MRTVELAGIPGSGKTTLLPAVKKGLLQSGVDVMDGGDAIIRYLGAGSFMKRVFPLLPERIRQVCAFRLFRLRSIAQRSQLAYVKQHADAFETVGEINEQRAISNTDRDLVLRSFLSTAGIWQIATGMPENTEACLLLDEGFAQKVVNLFVSVDGDVPSTNRLKRYLQAIPSPSLVFDVSAGSIEESMSRMIKRRPPRRLQGASDEEVGLFLHKARETLDMTMDLMAATGTRIVQLPNDGQAQSLEAAVEHAQSEGIRLQRSTSRSRP